MTQEEKKILLKDLCARLPYGVKILHTGWDSDRGTDFDTVETLIGIDNRFIHTIWDKTGDREKRCLSVSNWKPYLRPMSSMTEEELRDFAKTKFEFESDRLWEIVEFPKIECYKGFINVKCQNNNNGNTWIFQVNTRTPLETYWGIDWLNAHHFDYRGLIEKGLALEAKEGMYKTE